METSRDVASNNNVVRFLENLASNPTYNGSKSQTQRARKINERRRLLNTRRNIQSRMKKLIRDLNTTEHQITILEHEIINLNNIIEADEEN